MNCKRVVGRGDAGDLLHAQAGYSCFTFGGFEEPKVPCQKFSVVYVYCSRSIRKGDSAPSEGRHLQGKCIAGKCIAEKLKSALDNNVIM